MALIEKILVVRFNCWNKKLNKEKWMADCGQCHWIVYKKICQKATNDNNQETQTIIL